ncbi:uncharacterized protein EV420DRAFT_1606004, partial [Desarmillaria tabescens]
MIGADGWGDFSHLCVTNGLSGAADGEVVNLLIIRLDSELGTGPEDADIKWVCLHLRSLPPGFPLHAQQQTRSLRDFTPRFLFPTVITIFSQPFFTRFASPQSEVPPTRSPPFSCQFTTLGTLPLDIEMTTVCLPLRIRIPPASNANNLPNYTSQELAREQRLKNDPLAYIVEPSVALVSKLSEKSTYDGHHWQHSRLGGKEMPTGKKLPHPSPTPSLTSDEDSERVKDLDADSPPSPSVRPEPHLEPLATCDATIEEYLLRSHGIAKDYKLNYQSWSWSQLKLPCF